MKVTNERTLERIKKELELLMEDTLTCVRLEYDNEMNTDIDIYAMISRTIECIDSIMPSNKPL